MNIMGIDIGTTSISMTLMDEETGNLTARKTIDHRSFLPGEAPDEKIQDPQRIWRFVKEGLDGSVETYGKPSSIGLTGQMHGMLYVDGGGNAVSPLYTWQDGRGGRSVEGDLSCVDILNEKAGGAAAGYGLGTHFYLQKTGQIPASAKKMVTISDYIAMRLSGNREPVMGADMAASWGCFDLEKREFFYEALEKAGVDLSYLPEIRKEHFIVGETEDGIPVTASLGDNQASVFGSVASLSDTVLINVGTGSQVSVVTKRYVPCQGSIELRPCTEDSYLLAGSSLCGGRAYAMLEQFYREVAGEQEGSYYQKMCDQAQRFVDGYGVDAAWKVETTFSGTRSDPAKRGSITGIGVDNFHPGAMTVGVLTGIIRELYEQYEQMCRLTGKRAARLVGSGNGIRQNPLMQRLAEEMFGMEMKIPAYKEEAACGAALCALALLHPEEGPGQVQGRIRYL
ncbi:MAG: hypothetical protein HFH54_11615 [Lachnospiraceae bacterium]|nr:hypothetical protein [Lachnospiraceae bacterium]